MSVAIQSDGAESLRDEVTAEYSHEDPDVPDEREAPFITASMYSSEPCCGLY